MLTSAWGDPTPPPAQHGPWAWSQTLKKRDQINRFAGFISNVVKPVGGSCLQITDSLNHLVYVQPVPLFWPGFHHQQAGKKERWTSQPMSPSWPEQGVWVCSHDVRVCGVGQSQRSSVVLLIQLSLFKVQLIQSATDLSTFQTSLVVLWKLQNKQQSLLANLT